jgi:hypothetical protein
MLLAAFSGCISMEHGRDNGGGCTGCYNGGGTPPMVPGLVGAWGQPVPMAAPYSAAPPGAEAARAMLSRSVPLDIVQATAMSRGGSSGVVQASCANGVCTPNGLPAGTITPPNGMLAPPGFPAAPGLAPPAYPGGYGGPPVAAPGGVAAVGAVTGGPPVRFPTQRTEVRFVCPSGMKVSWFACSPDGRGGFASTQITAPGRYNFPQAAIYRLRLSDIQGRAGMVLYPTLEVVPSNSRTDPFLAHSAVPVEFTNEDLDQVAAGNYLVKVIYLPDPQFQDVATTGSGCLEEIVSSRLEPGTDPILEAQRRGSILLVIRMGNIDLELDNTPAMDAPNPYACPPNAPVGPGHGMGLMNPNMMVPYNLGANNPWMQGRPGQLPFGGTGPNGTMPAYPTLQPNPATGPAIPSVPPAISGNPMSQAAPASKDTTVAKLPEPSEVKPARYNQMALPVLTPTELAGMKK